MAVELATAYVNIVASSKGLGKGIVSELNGVQGKADSAGSKAGSSFGSGFIGTAAKIVGGLGLFTAVSKGASMAKDAIFGFNSQLQNADIGFTTMLGSGEKAKTFLDQLQQFAKATPFDFGSLVQSSQTLLGMGVSAKDIIPSLTALGDSVASVGGSSTQLNGVILAFGQTMAKGTLDMGNMNQMLQGGVPNALKILAAQYGVTTGEMVKMISTGKVQSSEALPLLVKGLEDGTSATAALGGMMDKQSRTMSGALANVADSATQLTAGAFKPLFDQVSSGAQILANFLSSDRVQKWADGVNKALTNTFSGAAVMGEDFWAGLTTPLDKLPNTVAAKLGKGIATGIAGAKAFIAPQATKLQTYLSGILLSMNGSSIKGKLPWDTIFTQGIDTAAAKAKPLIGKAVGGIQTFLSKQLGSTKPLPWDSILGKGFDKIKTVVTPLFDDLKGAFQNFWKAAGPVLKQLGQMIGPLIEELAPAFQQLMPLMNPLMLVFKAMAPLLPQIGDALGQIVSVIGNGLMQLIQGLTPLLLAVVDAVHRLMPFVQQLIASLLPPLVSLFQKIAPLLQAILGALIPLITKIANALIPIIEKLEPVVETVFGVISDLIGDAIEVFSGLIDFITGIFSGDWSKVWDGIKEIFSGVWNGIKDFATGVWKIIVSLAKTLWAPIKDYIVNPIKTAWDWVVTRFNDAVSWIGGVISTIISGLTTAWNAVKDAITTPIKAGWQWVVDRFDTVKGWVKGIVNQIAGVFTTAWKIIKDYIINPVRDGWQWVVDRFNDALTWIGGVVSDVVAALSGAWNWVYDHIVTPVKNAIDWVKTAWTDLKNWFAGQALDPSGGKFNSALAGIAGAHAGGGVLGPGMNLVGEEGPEIIDGLTGRVYTTGQVMGNVRPAGSGPLHVVITVRGDGVITRAMAQEASVQVMSAINAEANYILAGVNN